MADKRVAILVVLVLFAIAGLLAWHDIAVLFPTRRSSDLGKRAADAPVRTLTGRSVRLRAYVGSPLWLNFFATWCVPCKTEMPAIEQEYRRFHGRGLEVVGLDQQEGARQVSAFTQALGISFPLLIDDGAVHDAYHVWATPTSVFIDRSGVVRAFHVGAMTTEQMDADLKTIL